MLHKNESRARAKNELQIAVINDARFAYEERNGNMSFNLTMMAKPFGKRPADWLKSQPTIEYLSKLSVMSRIVTADLLEVRQGGIPERQGTWANDYRIAIRFAQWLDVGFAIAVDELVFKYFTKQIHVARADAKHGVSPIIHEGRPLYPYTDIVRALGGSTRSSASRRKAKYPNHFVILFGRNFITPQYVDLLAGYYNYRNAQLALNFGGQA